MKDIDNLLNKESRTELSNLIDHQLLFIKHEEFKHNKPEVFQRIGLLSNNGIYCLDNPMDWFENSFNGPDYLSHFLFFPVEKEEDFEYKMGLENFRRFPVNEKIADILLVDDYVNVFKRKNHWQFWNSTEGVIIKTTSREYAFYKANTMWNEMVLIYRGQNVLSKIESLKTHWDVFGIGYDALVERKLVSLKNKSVTDLGSEKIIGRD